MNFVASSSEVQDAVRSMAPANSFWAWYLDWKETLKYSVPALLYFLDNNLLFVVLSLIDPPTFTLLNNIKVLITALLYQFFLKRKVTRRQWLALVLLLTGVVISQVSKQSKHASSGNGSPHHSDKEGFNSHGDFLLGVMIVGVMASFSSFANIYTEYVFKGKAAHDPARERNVHKQNMNLYMFGVLFNGLALITVDYKPIMHEGIFRGYTGYTVAVIVGNACVGLGISFILKWANNMVHIFATSFSLLTTVILSMVFFSFYPTSLFILGAGVVITAIYLYNVGRASLTDDEAPVEDYEHVSTTDSDEMHSLL